MSRSSDGASDHVRNASCGRPGGMDQPGRELYVIVILYIPVRVLWYHVETWARSARCKVRPVPLPSPPSRSARDGLTVMRLCGLESRVNLPWSIRPSSTAVAAEESRSRSHGRMWVLWGTSRGRAERDEMRAGQPTRRGTSSTTTTPTSQLHFSLKALSGGHEHHPPCPSWAWDLFDARWVWEEVDLHARAAVRG